MEERKAAIRQLRTESADRRVIRRVVLKPQSHEAERDTVTPPPSGCPSHCWSSRIFTRQRWIAGPVPPAPNTVCHQIESAPLDLPPDALQTLIPAKRLRQQRLTAVPSDDASLTPALHPRSIHFGLDREGCAKVSFRGNLTRIPRPNSGHANTPSHRTLAIRGFLHTNPNYLYRWA